LWVLRRRRLGDPEFKVIPDNIIEMLSQKQNKTKGWEGS
jgi:hypothetical protein